SFLWDSTSLIRLSRANSRPLFIPAGPSLPIRSLKGLNVNRVDVTLVVYQPVASFAALYTAPLLIFKPLCVEIQLNRGDRGPLSLSILLQDDTLLLDFSAVLLMHFHRPS